MTAHHEEDDHLSKRKTLEAYLQPCASAPKGCRTTAEHVSGKWNMKTWVGTWIMESAVSTGNRQDEDSRDGVEVRGVGTKD